MKQSLSKSVHNRNKRQENREIYDEFRKKEHEGKEERLKFLELLSESMSLPPDVLSGAPIITMHGRSALYIENYKKISEYSEEEIVVQTGICQVFVEGKKLKIEYFTKAEMKISGFIKKVCYQSH